jgi:hypothetical protein
MKGPHERLKYDLRRVWECPVCGHCDRTPGHVTTRLCDCQKQVAPESRKFMRLRHNDVRRVHSPAQQVVPPTVDVDTVAIVSVAENSVTVETINIETINIATINIATINVESGKPLDSAPQNERVDVEKSQGNEHL